MCSWFSFWKGTTKDKGVNMLKFKTKCGYIAYKCTYNEMHHITGGYYTCICDYCLAKQDTYYLIPVLNGSYCSKCFERWNNEAIFYTEDLAFENSFIRHIEKIAKQVGVTITKQRS